MLTLVNVHVHALCCLYAHPRSPCSTCASVGCDRTRTPHRPRTRNPSSPLRCFPPWCPAGIPGAHVRLPLSHDCDFSPRAFPQSRAAADQYASLLATPACFSLPRDCPILRPRAVGCLSRAEGMRLSVRDELQSHMPHAIPLILPACCGLLHACVETLQAPFELATARGPISPCCRIHTRLLFAGCSRCSSTV